MHRKCKNEFEYKGVVWNDYTSMEALKNVETFEFRQKDICVCTFPRSGTTVTQEIIWQIVNRKHVQKDQKVGDIDERFPFLEFNCKFDREGKNKLQEPVDLLNKMPMDQDRLVKTHCPYSFIKDTYDKVKPKTVVTVRNPKDCAVSMFHFYKGLKMFGPWGGTWEEFFDIFMTGKTKSGNWFQVVQEWWKLKEEPYILFLKYEDIVQDPIKNVQKIADFLQESLTSEELDLVLHNSNFKTMSQNSNVNFKDEVTGFNFMRKGKIGDWKNWFTAEQSKLMDDKVNDMLTSKGLTFQYE